MKHQFNGGVLIIVLLLMNLAVFGQDIHYSQFANSPMNLNPGLTGAFNGDMRFVSNFRPQWTSVPVSYTQFSFAMDAKFFNKKRNGPLAAGIIFNYDQAGDSQLTLSQLSLAGSYSIKLDEDMRNFFTVGLTAGGIQRRIDFFNLNFDAQYNGLTFDPNLPTGEVGEEQNITFGEFSAGVNLHLAQKDKPSMLDAGFGVFHINQPVKSFEGLAEVVLERRYSAYIDGVKNLNSHLDGLFRVTHQRQGPAQETLAGLGLRTFLVKRPTKIVALELNGYYRWNDAVIPSVGLRYNGWSVHLSYDANTSQFREATTGLGGLEIAAIYILTEVPFASYCPHCPAFL